MRLPTSLIAEQTLAKGGVILEGDEHSVELPSSLQPILELEIPWDNYQPVSADLANRPFFRTFVKSQIGIQAADDHLIATLAPSKWCVTFHHSISAASANTGLGTCQIAIGDPTNAANAFPVNVFYQANIGVTNLRDTFDLRISIANPVGCGIWARTAASANAADNFNHAVTLYARKLL